MAICLPKANQVYVGSSDLYTNGRFSLKYDLHDMHYTTGTLFLPLTNIAHKVNCKHFFFFLLIETLTALMKQSRYHFRSISWPRITYLRYMTNLKMLSTIYKFANLPVKLAIYLKSSLFFLTVSIIFSVYKQAFTAQKLKS